MKKLNDIEKGALRVVANVPLRPSHEHGTAYVPWRIIIQLRKDLEAAGIDWKHIHTLVAQEKAAAKARIRERYK